MYRVMVVDDDIPFLHNLMSYDWAGLGCCCVCAAHNGKEALEKCSQYMPHIVITDINMPTMDGIELSHILKETFPQIRIILLTVHQDFSYAQQAIGYGVSDYLIKDTQYRLQLPKVIARAISSFDSQPDGHAGFLKNSEKLLILDNSIASGSSELEEFLAHTNGTLITLRMSKPYPERKSILRYIDQYITLDAGWILNGEDCLEMIGEQKEQMLEAIRFFRKETCQPEEKEYYCVYTRNVVTVADYMTAHAENLKTLDTTFYGAKEPPLISHPVEFARLPMNVSGGWEHRVISPSSEEALSTAFGEIKAECAREKYDPEEVKNACMQFVRLAEVRWARSVNAGIYLQLQSVRTLERLIETVSRYIIDLYRSRNANSYQCSAALKYMESNLADPELSLNSVAEKVYMSPGYLSKKLKEETGYSFRDLLTKMRMERAAGLISEGKYKIYEIAVRVGYQNYRSFAVAFESFYGMSVKKYRGAAK